MVSLLLFALFGLELLQVELQLLPFNDVAIAATTLAGPGGYACIQSPSQELFLHITIHLGIQLPSFKLLLQVPALFILYNIILP